jgi:WD40 repeat protein
VIFIQLWDIEKGIEKQQIAGHVEMMFNFTWNYTGSLIATTSRDKKIRVFDVRSNQIVQVIHE